MTPALVVQDDESLSTLSLNDPNPPAADSVQPRLPPEILERIIHILSLGSILNDPISERTLVQLSSVSRLIRHWALQSLYRILVLPRHVREFRKWCARSRGTAPPFQFAGYTQAIFSGLNDVSRLTVTSAGWEAEFLRMLHYCGPSLTHVSLWRSESTVVLRDPSQVRGTSRFGNRAPVWTWGEGGVVEEVTDQPTEREEEEDERLIDRKETDEMPNWLRAEIASQGTQVVSQRHKAQVTTTRTVEPRVYGCRPTHLSLVLSLPLYENEDPSFFAMMMIWSRVQELDIYAPTPAQMYKILVLLAGLFRSPIRKLKISNPHATLYLEGGVNLPKVLMGFLNSEPLRESLLNEFKGKHFRPVDKLERLLVDRTLVPSEGSFRLKIIQGKQDVWGKLKDRLSEFHQRTRNL